MNNLFNAKARDYKLNVDAKLCVGMWAIKKQIDLNTVKVLVGTNGTDTVMEVGEHTTGKFILVTMSVNTTTVGIYEKVGFKMERTHLISFEEPQNG